MATKHPVNPKAAMTGAGTVTQKPGNSDGGQAGKVGVGPSNHEPKTGEY